MNVCLRNVNKRDWVFLKTEASRKNTTISRILHEIVSVYAMKKKSETNWETILGRDGMLARKDAENMKAAASELRSGFNFR